MYVAVRIGWFRCRSVCYMAPSRPVIVQVTRITRFVPCRDGVLPRHSIAEAAQYRDSAESDCQRHSSAGQVVARNYFEATSALADFIENAVA